MATTSNQDMLKAARNHFKKHKKKYIIGLIAYGVFMVLLITFAIVYSGSGDNSKSETCDLQHMTGQMTCEEYDKDARERCEYSLETDDEGGFNEKKLDGKTCQDRGFEWVDKEKEERERIEAEKQQCESGGKRWYNDSLGCVTQEKGADLDREAKEATDAYTAQQNVLDDAKRKCTVMEASDIYRTGGNSSNAFSTARTTCDTMYSSVYKYDQDTFMSDVTIDWNSRKNERIDGNDLTYHLNNLGW
jgi:hypothetical protein